METRFSLGSASEGAVQCSIYRVLRGTLVGTVSMARLARRAELDQMARGRERDLRFLNIIIADDLSESDITIHRVCLASTFPGIEWY